MEKVSAYGAIKHWAARLKITLKDTTDPLERIDQLAEAVAVLRLKPMDLPEEPDREAVRNLLLEYLEARVQRAAAEKIVSLENQPYFGCHRTADTKPPHPPRP
ncbi:MAG: hypothetical protein HYZ52_04780 [Candidatus Omnitrophica bacterium]|nr:hypothetical protein [Candidatus Omnitrophota bacterium]